MKKAYKIEVTMIVKKQYTVVADSEEEAVEKLSDSGMVCVASESDREESYDEDYDVLDTVEVEEPDVE